MLDSIYQVLNWQFPTFAKPFPWKTVDSVLWIRNSIVQIFPKMFLKFDTYRFSKSLFSVSTGLLWSMTISVQSSSFVVDDSIENSFFYPCFGILEVRKFQKVHYYWYVLTFERTFDHNYKFDFSHQGLNRKFYTIGRELDSHIFFRDLVQTSDSLKFPKCGIDHDSTRDSFAPFLQA